MASKRKKSSRGLSRRRIEGEGVFSRVAPASASNLPAGMPVALAWRGYRHPRLGASSTPDVLGQVPVSTFDRLAQRQAEHLQRQLEALDLDPEVAASIAAIDPDGSYAMVVTLRGYNGASRAKDITYAGRGRSLHERIAFLAGGDDVEIVNVEFIELLSFDDDYQGSYALWKRDAVVTADGERFDGLGDFVRWRRARDKRVGGRPKKRRGRHTYAVGKKIADTQRKAELRQKITRHKIRDLKSRAKHLEKSGARGLAAKLRAQARAVEKRSEAGRKKGTGKNT